MSEKLLQKTKKQTDYSNTIKNLENNNFEVFWAYDIQMTKDIFIHQILPNIKCSSVSYADSQTLHTTGILEMLRNKSEIEFIDTFNPANSWKEQIYQRKKALTADLFLTGTNAITEAGQLVNLDMVGNRVAALAFGPRNVVLFVGINKIVKNLDEAFQRIKNIAAPMNAKHHPNLKTPCQTTGTCSDCSSPQRICNTWTITEKSYPKHRIKIVLIDRELGF